MERDLRNAAPHPAPELFPCPVRRRYVRQVFRYGPVIRRWERDLRAAFAGEARGAEAAADRLRALLRAAEEGTRWYPESFARAGVSWRDLRDADDLAHFPALARSDVQARFHDLFHRDVGEIDIDEGWLGRTSGSTGEPIPFFMDAASIHFFSAFVRFLWHAHARRPLPFPGTGGVVLLCTLPRSAIYGARLPLFRFGRFRKLHWGEPSAARTLERLAPAVITGDPDSLAPLAESRARVRPTLVLSSAFPLARDLSARIGEATGAVVVDYYSLAETGPIAWRCTAGEDLFHVLEGAVEVESERGELLVTNLRNPLFPLVRYRTGDLASVERRGGACRCGAHGRVLTGFAGRVSSRFVTEHGRRFDPSQLQPLLSALPLAQFQLLQTEPGAITLRYHGERAIGPESLAPLEQAASRLAGRAVSFSLARADAPIFRSGEKPLVYRSLVTTS